MGDISKPRLTPPLLSLIITHKFSPRSIYY